VTKEVVVFGSIPLAVRVARTLLGHPRVELAGIVAAEEPISAWHGGDSRTPMLDFAREAGVQKLSLSRIPAQQYDIGFTVRFDQILRPDVIRSFRFGIVNFHGGWLPAYRGVHVPVHAILNGEKYFGVTLHLIDEGVDTGDILYRERTPIEETDTSYSLFMRSQEMLWKLFSAHLDDILSGSVARLPQAQAIETENAIVRTYRRSDVEALREVSSSADSAEMLRQVRAFDFPGHERAWIRVGKRKVYLFMSSDGFGEGSEA
jgi:methionyl-tRNA formyltransferase